MEGLPCARSRDLRPAPRDADKGRSSGAPGDQAKADGGASGGRRGGAAGGLDRAPRQALGRGARRRHAVLPRAGGGAVRREGDRGAGEPRLPARIRLAGAPRPGRKAGPGSALQARGGRSAWAPGEPDGRYRAGARLSRPLAAARSVRDARPLPRLPQPCGDLRVPGECVRQAAGPTGARRVPDTRRLRGRAGPAVSDDLPERAISPGSTRRPLGQAPGESLGTTAWVSRSAAAAGSRCDGKGDRLPGHRGGLRGLRPPPWSRAADRAPRLADGRRDAAREHRELGLRAGLPGSVVRAELVLARNVRVHFERGATPARALAPGPNVYGTRGVSTRPAG